MNPPTIRSIALFDSGLGGITVLSSCLRVSKSANYLYLGDTARTPYGSKGAATIRRYASEAVRFFEQFSPDLFVIACNTVSACALDAIKGEVPCSVIGTIDPAVRAALTVSRNKKIGVIGTQATIHDGCYEREILKLEKGAQIISQACPLFVPLVEEGLFQGKIVQDLIAHYLVTLKESEVDTVILGCTHYPYLRGEIQKFFGESVTLVCCADEIANEVASHCSGIVQKDGLTNHSINFYITDPISNFNLLAGEYLHRRGINAEVVSLES